MYVCVCVCVCACVCVCVLCDPMDCSLLGSSIHGILQARILEWIAIPSSKGSSWPNSWTLVSYVSCTGRWILYHQRHVGSPLGSLLQLRLVSHLHSHPRQGRKASVDTLMKHVTSKITVAKEECDRLNKRPLKCQYSNPRNPWICFIPWQKGLCKCDRI